MKSSTVDGGGGGAGGGGDQKAGRIYHHQRQCERARERETAKVCTLPCKKSCTHCPVLSCPVWPKYTNELTENE